MDSPTLRDALGTSEQALKDVIRYGRLGIPKGKQGSRRNWSREDAILSGYYLAACKAGVPANDAAGLARFWTDTKDGQEFDIWIFNIEEPFVYSHFPRGDTATDGISIQNAFGLVAKDDDFEWTETISPPVPPQGIVVINLSGIRSRIDAATSGNQE